MSEALTVPLGLLRRYLALRGWTKAERADVAGGILDQGSFAANYFRQRAAGPSNIDMYVLAEPTLDSIEMVVPKELGTSDAVRRLQGVINTLSQVEEKDPLQIVAAIRSIAFDVVTSRVPDEMVTDDTIHLDQAVSYTGNIKKLLAASATTEMSPDVYFFRIKREASHYADNCRFGHTFKGSFGFTIESPVVPNDEPVFPGMDQQAPFERRVIQRLAQGIEVVQKAVTTEDPDLVVNGFGSGFSANMCEEFAELIQDTAPGGIGFGFLFSPEWPAPKLDELWVGPQHVEMSLLAAKTMREQTPLQPMEIFGRITRLQNEANPQDLLDQTHEREIVISWKSREFGIMNVRIALGPAQYLSAVEAHLQGRMAQATGRLEKQGRFWRLVDVTAFAA